MIGNLLLKAQRYGIISKLANLRINKLGYFSIFGFLGRYLYFGRCGVLPVSFLYRFYREGKG